MDNDYFHWLLDSRRKFQNVRDPSILTWSGELLTPELYEKYKDTLPKEKGSLVRNFLEIFLTIVFVRNNSGRDASSSWESF